MRLMVMWHAWGTLETDAEIWSENPKGRDNSEDVSINVRIILK
jgi:hypothetical protein